MSELINRSIFVHGGYSRWTLYCSLKVKINSGGTLWEIKGHPGLFTEVNLTIKMLEQQIYFSDFGAPGLKAMYTPYKVSLLNDEDEPLQELSAPRLTFTGHKLNEQWSLLQAVYFLGYAIWNYTNCPYYFAQPEFLATEIEPWRENGEIWRRALVRFPAGTPSHSGSQIYYFSPDGLIRRQDYQIDISGGLRIAHYLSDYVDILGFQFSTKRRLYIREEDRMPMINGPLVLSVDYSEFELFPL